MGDIWAILGIWHQLKLAQTISRKARSRRRRIDVERLVRVMVMNRLSDPQSKLGLLRWLEQVSLPGIDKQTVQHQHLLRAMDTVLKHKEAIEEELISTLLPLLDTEMEVVVQGLAQEQVHGLSLTMTAQPSSFSRLYSSFSRLYCGQMWILRLSKPAGIAELSRGAGD